jgi:hypothetical protein
MVFPTECDREASIIRGPWPHWGLLHHGKKNAYARTSGVGRTIMALFYVLLTVHLGIILVKDQPDAQFFFFLYVYFNPLHVSSTSCSSSGELIVSIQRLVYVTLCRWPFGLHTRITMALVLGPKLNCVIYL